MSRKRSRWRERIARVTDGPTRNVGRGIFVVLLVLSLATVGYGYVTERDDYGPYVQGEDAVPPRENPTVVTTSQRETNFIVAFNPDGTVRYYNDSVDIYDDVDPSPVGRSTVTYVGTNYLGTEACPSSTGCHRSVIERVNLTTGETERLYSQVIGRDQNHWHDVDRIGKNRFLIADIAHDRVFVLNTKTGTTEWGWNAQYNYSVKSGGLFPGDWTHLNDVERLPDGRVMADLRNQDQVVFINRTTGLQENWTLGSDNKHAVLYEQHNPDYIPEERGGPAVLVADSENGRIVEYQRRDGQWERTWTWTDAALQWPRDADRLPNGHTLVTDTNGGRIVEVDRQGDVVWTVQIKGAYDAERLNTGDESAGGPSAQRAGLESQTPASAGAGRDFGPVDRALFTVKDAVPSLLLSASLNALPPWTGYVEWVAILVFSLTLVAWILAEAWWSPWTIRLSRKRSE